MDDYYRTVGTYEIPPDPENGVPDLESPECMNLPLLSQHLAQLVAGEEIELPRFDFETRFVRARRASRCALTRTRSCSSRASTRSTRSSWAIWPTPRPACTCRWRARSRPRRGRALSRICCVFCAARCATACFAIRRWRKPLGQWNSVRRGERLYISPYRGQANLTVDTFLSYELNILMTRLEPQLRAHAEALADADLAPVGAMLGQVEPIDYADLIPDDSVLHEFIG